MFGKTIEELVCLDILSNSGERMRVNNIDLINATVYQALIFPLAQGPADSVQSSSGHLCDVLAGEF